MSRIRTLGACLVTGFAMQFATTANANLTLDFGGITENDGTGQNPDTGESQLQIDILSGGGGLRVVDSVTFVIKNLGPGQSTITDIFFEDTLGILGEIIGIDNSDPGVDYVTPSNQGNLPGGNEFGFQATEGFSAEPTPPPSTNGVDPGEQVAITFSFASDPARDDILVTYEDLLVAISGGLFRIGLHVQNFPDGGSESFVNLPPGSSIPLPAPVFAGMAGLGLLGARRTRRIA